MPSRRRRIVLAAVALVLVAGLAFLAGFRSIVGALMAPDGAFADEAPLAAPDYADPAAWSALPDRADDAGDAAPTGFPAIDQTKAPVDVFYVHPTSYVGSHWNGPIDDPALNEATDRVATGIQATAFNGCCAVWAPRYRQANGTAFTTPGPDGELAVALAYDDVRRAFLEFEARRGAGRPFILAGHSQGSVLAEQLLVEEIAGTPRRDALVFAVLPGGSLTARSLAEGAPDVPACKAPDDVGCVVAWNARGPGYEPNAFRMQRRDPSELVCTNPLSWRGDGAAVPASANLGAVFLETDDHTPLPAFADAQCVAGTLVVREIGKSPRDLPSRILDTVIGPENYHPIEYQAFFMNLRENADTRVRAFLARPTPAPAPAGG